MDVFGCIRARKEKAHIGRVTDVALRLRLPDPVSGSPMRIERTIRCRSV